VLAITTEQVLIGLLVALVAGGLWEKHRDREEFRDRMSAKRERETDETLHELRQGLDEVRSQVTALEHQVEVNIKVDLEFLQEKFDERERDVEELRWKLDDLEDR